MEARSLLSAARQAQGLTQEAAVRRAGTSQPTLSASERGTKSPTLAVTERILRVIGYELDLTPRITCREAQLTGYGRTFHVPDRLWRLRPVDCFTPLTIRGSDRKPYDLTDRAERAAAAYIWLLEHGSPGQLVVRLDGALLVDTWPEMVSSLHADVRGAWAPLIESTLDTWLMTHLRGQEARRLRKPVSRQARDALTVVPGEARHA